MDRGILKAGLSADIVISILQQIHDVATFENHNQLSKGMESVPVNEFRSLTRAR